MKDGYSSTSTSPSALDPVVHVSHTRLALEDPGTLQLDAPGVALVEEAEPLAEEHRDDMEL